jgi:hypothetical protein
MGKSASTTTSGSGGAAISNGSVAMSGQGSNTVAVSESR